MDEPAMSSAIEPGQGGHNISGSMPAEFTTRHSSPVVIATVHGIAAGVVGLLVAAILAAAMSTIAGFTVSIHCAGTFVA